MEDRVGEMLAQRAQLENGIGAAVVLSLLLHGSVSAIAVWAAWHHPLRPAMGMINIRFARMPQAETVPAPIPAPQPKPIEAPKPAPKTAPPSPFGRSTKKPAEPPQQPSNPATQQPSVEIPLGGSAVTGLEGGDFPYTIYIERMKTLIGSRWFRPQISPTATTTVYFVIERDGTIRDAKSETASGNGTFDRAALRAVLESSPLPPLPFGYNGTYLGVHLTFR
jgi:TonB family protein